MRFVNAIRSSPKSVQIIHSVLNFVTNFAIMLIKYNQFFTKSVVWCIKTIMVVFMSERVNS